MNTNQVTNLLTSLVSIPSINPDLVPGGQGENQIALFVADWLTQAGLDVHLDEVQPGRPNVIARRRGSGGGRSLLINGHMDTVGVAGMSDPFKPRLSSGRLYGRGAYDMKGGLAAALLAAAQVVDLPLRGDLIITAVMDEEYAGLGSIDVAKRYRADAAVVAEPTEEQLIIAHKGFVWMEVETHGIAAHGSRPDLGVDAILHMGRVLRELEKLVHQFSARTAHPLLGLPSLHASLVTGGQELSSYPERCLLQLERRTLPGETVEGVEAEVTGILRHLAAEDPQFVARLRRGVDRAPMETPAEHALPEIIQEAVHSLRGQPARVGGVSYWTDAASLQQAGIPTVLFGPIGQGAHAVEEWVDVESVAYCARVFKKVIQDFCD